jgi:DNA polymerase-3 subunit alpha
MNRRGEVIEYVRRKYGNDQVAQIITFNTMAAKAAIKDVGRALDMPYGEVDRIAKLIPPTIGITIEQALKDSRPRHRVRKTRRSRSSSTPPPPRRPGPRRRCPRRRRRHRAAAAHRTRPRHPHQGRSHRHQLRHEGRRKMGLLKMDFLGLTTLTVIDDCLKLIKSNRGETVDLATIDLEDQTTFEKVFHRALTSGVFQFESGGMRDVLRRYKPNTIEHLTALNALYRPGPMSMIDDFIERKWGRKRGRIHAPRTRAAAQRDPRRHGLPGAGHADLERHRRLLARWRRPPAPRHG